MYFQATPTRFQPYGPIPLSPCSVCSGKIIFASVQELASRYLRSSLLVRTGLIVSPRRQVWEAGWQLSQQVSISRRHAAKLWANKVVFAAVSTIPESHIPRALCRQESKG